MALGWPVNENGPLPTTGKIELEYEGELVGGATIAKDLIRRACDATLRDRARSKPFQILYGMLAMGWRGSARHWHRYEMAYLLLAGLATPLVLSVHTIVSFDFAVGIIPGWHATIFPPYFVTAGWSICW